MGLWRRWSKASRDGSLNANIAKADMRASSKGNSTSPRPRIGKRTEMGAERAEQGISKRAFRASPRARAIASHSINPSGKIGNSGKHYAQ